ncbi:MAG: hypothetical protein RMJ98_09855 [Myxococcales bacterium]|nr:hypothetical protein [Polyangiaceae bacterium]MDW8249593.1 hypothetical protein [Myxococcales bacterium]
MMVRRLLPAPPRARVAAAEAPLEAVVVAVLPALWRAPLVPLVWAVLPVAVAAEVPRRGVEVLLLGAVVPLLGAVVPLLEAVVATPGTVARPPEAVVPTQALAGVMRAVVAQTQGVEEVTQARGGPMRAQVATVVGRGAVAGGRVARRVAEDRAVQQVVEMNSRCSSVALCCPQRGGAFAMCKRGAVQRR